MVDNVGQFLIYNGELRSIIERESFPDIDLAESKLVYEVIRLINGIPLFYQDHYIRLCESLKANGDFEEKSLERDMLYEQICSLASKNMLLNNNVKIFVYYINGNLNYLIYFIKSYYPSEDIVKTGVATDLFSWVRETPSVKAVQKGFKELVSQKLRDEKLFEVLLVNNEGYITEGSRSNVFFMKSGRVVTPPLEQVLAGITRKYIISTCTSLGYVVEEREFKTSELEEIDGLFISGTSIKVLPVKKVGRLIYESTTNEDIVKIRDRFDDLIKDYQINNQWNIKKSK